MEQMIGAFVVVAVLVGLGIASVIWGADTRPDFADDHNR